MWSRAPQVAERPFPVQSRKKATDGNANNPERSLQRPGAPLITGLSVGTTTSEATTDTVQLRAVPLDDVCGRFRWIVRHEKEIQVLR